jgi:hypothetical protein
MIRILSLGAGVQSTTVYLLARSGQIQPFDYAIFADTQEEPAAVYAHLEWLKALPEPKAKIIVATAGKLGDDLMKGQNSTRQKFASIPAYTAEHHETRTNTDPCREGITRRQCTNEYKIRVVENVIRRQILGLKPRKHIPQSTRIEHAFGISLDETRRAERIRDNWKNHKWSSPTFPLIQLGWTRENCTTYLEQNVPHQVTRSACVFCPFKSAAEWLETKANPKEWRRAVEIDDALRKQGNVINRKVKQALYLHRKCIPLPLIDLEAEAKKEANRKSRPLFDLMECEGMCGI